MDSTPAEKTDRPPYRADHVGSLLRPARLLLAREEKAAGRMPAEELRAVAGEYFETLRIPLVEGRTLDARDDSAGIPAVIVNASLVESSCLIDATWPLWLTTVVSTLIAVAALIVAVSRAIGETMSVFVSRS